jgi:hypothetical protein
MITPGYKGPMLNDTLEAPKKKPASPWPGVGANPQMISDPAPNMTPQSLPRPAAPQGTQQVNGVQTIGTGMVPQNLPRPAAPAAPAGDLRGTVFKPQMSGGTQEAANLTSGVAQRLGGWRPQPWRGVGTADYSGATSLYDKAQQMIPGAMGEFNPAQDTNRVRSLVLDRFEDSQPVNRMDLAMGLYGNLEEASRPAWEAELRHAGQKNAALGRLGSGMMTTELSDITDSRQKNLGDLRYRLANEAAGATLDDNLKMLGAGQSLLGQFGGEDRANQGMNLDIGRFNLDRGSFTAGLGDRRADIATQLYGQRADERNSELGYGIDSLNAQRGLMESFGGLERQRFDQDLTGRNEMRAEREFQNNMSQQGIDNALRQRLTEEQIFGNDYDRMLRGAATFGGIGYGNDASGAALAGAGQYGQQAQNGMSALGELGQNWSYIDWARRNGMIV